MYELGSHLHLNTDPLIDSFDVHYNPDLDLPLTMTTSLPLIVTQNITMNEPLAALHLILTFNSTPRMNPHLGKDYHTNLPCP